MRIAGNLVTPSHSQLTDGLPGWLRSGGEMILKIAFALLTVWLFGVLGLYKTGDLVHVLLLVGLMLFLLGALKARDAAAARGRSVDSAKP